MFFENTQCLKCGGVLGFLPDAMDLATVERSDNQQWRALTREAHAPSYKRCTNAAQYNICNWMIPSDDPRNFCQACRLNKVIPDLHVQGNLLRWAKLEIAKRRVLYTLKHIGLPIESNEKDRSPLRFSFLGDPSNGPRVMTGHENGLITVNICEADDAVREQHRVELKELYRTLLGHLRHEIAHYYWDRLIANSPRLQPFREVFGNETADYNAALQAHYRNGAPPDWGKRFVTSYASSHPWEDWAETFAHYLHIEDMVETASGFGMSLRPRHPDAKAMTADLKTVNDLDANFDRILEAWLPLTYALNEINRGMGLPDLYPFVLSNKAIEKLRFVHRVAREPARQAAS